MWQFLWPEKKVQDVPITYITNGVHTGTWLARRMGVLFDEYLPEGWRTHIDDPEMWEAVLKIPDEDLWEVRLHLKRKLVAYMRERARQQWLHDNIHPVQVVAAGSFARSLYADHRLCPPLCHLQARRPDPAGFRPPAEDGQPARICRCRSSLPARPTPPMNRASC